MEKREERSDGLNKKNKIRPIDYFDYGAKIVLLGDNEVGKTTLLQGDEDQTLSVIESVYNKTIGINFRIKIFDIDGSIFKIDFWDCPGDHRSKVIANKFCIGAVGIIYVYDVCNRKSFDNLNTWLDLSKDASDQCIKMLIGNKPGLFNQEKRVVSQEEAMVYAKIHEMEYIETIAVTGENVNIAFETILSALVDEFPIEEDSLSTSLLGKNITLGPRKLEQIALKENL